MSKPTCQNVTIAYQHIDAVRPRPGDSTSQSGRVNSRSGDHQTTASDACCKNSTRVPAHGGAATAAMSPPWENRTVRPLSYRGSTSGVPGSRRTVNTCHSVLALGGPAHSTEEKPIPAMSGR